MVLVEQRRIEAGKQKDAALFKRLGRVKEKENEKLAQLQGRPDQTLTAKVKCGEIFFQLGKMDEARVLLSFAEPMIEDAELSNLRNTILNTRISDVAASITSSGRDDLASSPENRPPIEPG